MTASLSRHRSLFPFGPLWDDLFKTTLGLPKAETTPLEPALDVTEDRDEIVITAELPGIPKERVNVSLEDGVLTISGEKAVSAPRDNETRLIRERRYGRFHRALTLPTTIDTDKAEADFVDGLLVVRLPKHEQVKPRNLDIK